MTVKEFHEQFVVFILTHGRAENQSTYKAVRRQGYTGRVVFVLDNEDEEVPTYQSIYGRQNCYVFDKEEWNQRSDNILAGDKRAILYARNACFEIAKELGFRYFIELDDDYTQFVFRFNDKAEVMKNTPSIKSLDNVWMIMLEYYRSIPCLSLAMCQGGDYIGGVDSPALQTITLKRKAMNSFICDVQRPFEFKGRFNDDVNTYTRLGCRGGLFFSTTQLSLNQKGSQQTAGGMTDVYKDAGTYVKSFMSVVVHPSGVRIAVLVSKHRRIHHNVRWNNTAPKILHEKYRKL